MAYSPLEATASDPPRSTKLAMVPPWMILRRFCRYQSQGASRERSRPASRAAYGVVLGDLELEVHAALGGVGDAELAGRG